MLRDLRLESSYRSDRHSVLRDFHLPCLSESFRYDRAVGYFTSESLSLAARGLTRLIQNGGSMRLVASPVLSEDDVRAIDEGYSRRDAIEAALIQELRSDRIPDATRDRLGFLAWMIGEGLLDIKIALVDNGAGFGIYHEKMGVFTDTDGNRVAFSGSANESVGGLRSNFEAIDVFQSWIASDSERVERRVLDFDSLWEDATGSLEVLPFPEAAAAELLRFRPPREPRLDPEEVAGFAARVDRGPHMPPSLRLRSYQKEAVKAWFQANGSGIFAMATGTGKTLTALAAITELFQHLRSSDRPIFAVIVCPYKHLVQQWSEEALRFGMDPILCFESAQDWMPSIQDAIAGQSGGHLPFVLAITTNATFAGEQFQRLLQTIQTDFALVGDEVHNLGARHLSAALPQNAGYRLGLSATPYRHLDDTGTQSLFAYFGEPVYEIDLQRAISLGVLTPYDYVPVPVSLEDDELGEYIELTKRIGRMMGPRDEDPSVDDLAEGPLKMYLLKRARLLGRARGKLSTLYEIMREFRSSTHNLVYCSDASGPVVEGGPSIRQIDAVVRILGTDLRMHVNSYTHETSTADRSRVRHALAAEDIQALVAIRCLDEGIDIPEVRRGFILASSTNPRQFIQRRGRLLRKSEGKTIANLYDFIAIPPEDSLDPETFEIERRLVRRELERVVEFAGGAQNGEQAMASLLDVRSRYHLLDIG